MLESLLHFGLCHYVACWVRAVPSAGEDRGSMASRKLETYQNTTTFTAVVWRRVRLIILDSGTALY